MTEWEDRMHNEQPYVRITPSERAKLDTDEIENVEVFYAATARALIVSLNENVLKRALDRLEASRKAREEGKEIPRSEAPWLGTHLALQVKHDFLTLVEALTNESYQEAMQVRAWDVLPILNEWRRLHPSESPVAFHERFWKTRLVCPGGGRYVWNEEWQTMESTVYGHPGEPKAGPPGPPFLTTARSANFGMTFENGGLRARLEIEREVPRP
jgi:hypothetical protein